MTAETETGELQRKLVAIEDERKALKEQLEAAEAQEKTDYVNTVRQYCIERGWDLAEIAGRITGLGAKTKGKSKRPFKPSTVWVDPENEQNIYVGRGLPLWMRERMTKLGYDMKDADSRKRFRDEVLIQQAA
jgi:hypothetical protein